MDKLSDDADEAAFRRRLGPGGEVRDGGAEGHPGQDWEGGGRAERG